MAVAFDLPTTGYVLENARVAPSVPTTDFKANLHEKKAYVGLQIYVRLEAHLLNSNLVKRMRLGPTHLM